MSKSILFVIDEIELKYFEFNDLVTNFWFIKEFLKRNYNVSICVKGDLFIENAKGCVFSRKSYLKNEDIFYNKEKSKNLINDFDVVFFRPDPPVDINYINACYVFDYVDREKTLLINDPSEIKNFNEKFHINYFPDFVPENIVTSSQELIIDFVEKNKEAILKPLNRCFGSGVYYLKNDDKNLLTIVNTMTENGKTNVMVQKYIPQAKDGDKRVLIIGDVVMEECIQKLPGEHNFKFSIHSDKFFKDTTLSQNEKIMAQKIATKLSTRGLYLVGLDVINEKVIEINVTSPCYFIREINQHYGIHFEEKIMAHLEKLIEKHFSKERVYAVNG
jgi:glutathione synthase